MNRLTRDGAAEPVSRDHILRHVRGYGNIHFPLSITNNLPQPLPPFPVNVRTIVTNNTKSTNDNQNSTNKSVDSTYNAMPATAVVLAINPLPMSPSVPPTTQYWAGVVLLLRARKQSRRPHRPQLPCAFSALGIQCVYAALAGVAGPCVCVCVCVCFWRACTFHIYLH